MEKLYRIEELCTDGWALIEKEDQGLTREQAKARLDVYLSDGIAPSRLRAVIDNA
jgi:AmiR/NasT family two-component response regulator